MRKPLSCTYWELNSSERSAAQPDSPAVSNRQHAAHNRTHSTACRAGVLSSPLAVPRNSRELGIHIRYWPVTETL